MRRFCAASGSPGNPQAAVGMALDALEALLVDPAAHQHVVGHVRARRRKPPVVVGAGAVGPAIGVAAHDQRLGDVCRILAIFSMITTMAGRGSAEAMANMPKS